MAEYENERITRRTVALTYDKAGGRIRQLIKERDEARRLAEHWINQDYKHVVMINAMRGHDHRKPRPRLPWEVEE